MTEPTTDESVWCIFRLALGDSGAVYCFRRPESKNPDMLLSIPDAKPGAYQLVLRAEDRSCEERKVTGEELRRGIRVTLPQPRTSLVMEYVRI